MGHSLGGIRPHASEGFECFICWQTVNSGLELPTRSNEINWIAEIWNNNNWLPSLDTFRTFVALNAVRSNHPNCFWTNEIPIKPAHPSRLGAK
jgi:hypothetical protein